MGRSTAEAARKSLQSACRLNPFARTIRQLRRFGDAALQEPEPCSEWRVRIEPLRFA
jgi:hypothetical protein